MDSIEKLRGWETSVLVEEGGVTTIGKICDEIEAEIERDYMRLPVDADGVPIHVGDLIEYRCIEGTYRLHAQGVYVYREGRCEGKKCVMNERLGIWFPELCYHVKPRTIEDVLRDLLDEHPSIDYHSRQADYRFDAEVIAKYADELREMMEVDA